MFIHWNNITFSLCFTLTVLLSIAYPLIILKLNKKSLFCANLDVSEVQSNARHFFVNYWWDHCVTDDCWSADGTNHCFYIRIYCKKCVVFNFGFLAITVWPQARTVSLHFTMKPSIQKMHYHFYQDWTFLHLLHISRLHTAVFKTISSHAKVTYLILFLLLLVGCWLF